MDLDFASTVKLFEELQASFDQASPNLDKCKQILEKLKVNLHAISRLIICSSIS
jgi:hypothetical protein